MKISEKQLRKFIREQLTLSERVRPETLDIDPESMEFQVMADPTRPEEGEEAEMIRGKISRHKGKYLPKADPENLPFGYESTRSVSGQLASQMGDQLRSVLNDLGYTSSDAEETIRRATKGELLSSQLELILQLGQKLRGKADQQSVKDAVDAILNIKLDFDVPDPTRTDVEQLEESVGHTEKFHPFNSHMRRILSEEKKKKEF
jgi:protein-tyrosine-phosphatase|tara:strand:- start:737 stop:1348 length:612 start_codon:yes stop_codon:yes gene_type:complete